MKVLYKVNQNVKISPSNNCRLSCSANSRRYNKWNYVCSMLLFFHIQHKISCQRCCQRPICILSLSFSIMSSVIRMILIFKWPSYKRICTLIFKKTNCYVFLSFSLVRSFVSFIGAQFVALDNLFGSNAILILYRATFSLTTYGSLYNRADNLSGTNLLLWLVGADAESSVSVYQCRIEPRRQSLGEE